MWPVYYYPKKQQIYNRSTGDQCLQRTPFLHDNYRITQLALTNSVTEHNLHWDKSEPEKLVIKIEFKKI